MANSGTDIFWRDLATANPPRRANSISDGPYGIHLAPAADANLVVYRAPGIGGPPGGPTLIGSSTFSPGGPEGKPVGGGNGSFQVWATDLTAPRKHYAVSTHLGTDASRPAIVGTRVAWSDLPCSPADPGCFGNNTFQKDPLTSGSEVELSSPSGSGGSVDADGTKTAWACSTTKGGSRTRICVQDGATLTTFDLTPFLLDPGSTVGNFVRISGNTVVWWELFEGTFDIRLHALNIGTGAGAGDDEILGDGPDVVSEFPDFDVSGSNVVWAGAQTSENAKLWRNTVSGGCDGDTTPNQCDHTGSATPYEVPVLGRILSQVSMSGTRVGWLECQGGGGFQPNCDVYTRTLSEPDSHLVTNTSDAQVDSPYVDGDRIYWTDTRNGNPDIYMESVSGATLPPADTTPPGPPSSFTAGANTGSVALSWVNPTGTDFFRVRILRKSGTTPPASLDDTFGSVIYEGNATSFVDTDVSPTLKYSYRIVAFDLDGNYSSTVTATTP